MIPPAPGDRPAPMNRPEAPEESGYPLGDSMMKAWVRDQKRRLWTIEDLAKDLDGEIKTTHSQAFFIKPFPCSGEPEEYIDVRPDAFVKLIREEWRGFQTSTGLKPSMSGWKHVWNGCNLDRA